MSTTNPIIRNNRFKLIYQPFPFNLGQQFLNSFFPHFTKSWNNLEPELQTETEHEVFKQKLKINLKPKKHKHFYAGSKEGNRLLTHIRVGRSLLNLHVFTIGKSDSPSCLCDRIESTEHFLLHCFLFTEERKVMFSSVQQQIPNFNNYPNKKKMDILLFGINLERDEIDCRNKRIMKIVQTYILKTKRFKSN